MFCYERKEVLWWEFNTTISCKRIHLTAQSLKPKGNINTGYKLQAASKYKYSLKQTLGTINFKLGIVNCELFTPAAFSPAIAVLENRYLAFAATQ
jgi:hypothetical protein